MKPPTPIVSVLMPCYNSAQTVNQALDSIFSQTLPDFELIAVDDGSTDGTAQLLQQRAASDPRLNVIDIPHRGIVSALKRGLEACRAPYVARMDSDDIAHPDRLRLQVNFLELNPQIGVAGCLVKAFPEDQVRQGFQVYLDWLNTLVDDSSIRREIFIESPLPHPSVTFRKEAVLSAGGYLDTGWAEDYDLWLRLYLAGVGFGKVPEVLLDWREDAGRLTRTDPRYSLENFIRAKAHYLPRGPLAGRESVIIWGAGMTGRRICKQLVRQDGPVKAFIDVDQRKIGRTKRGFPVYSPDKIPELWESSPNPVLLSAVAARSARALIREYMVRLKFVEGIDFWMVA